MKTKILCVSVCLCLCYLSAHAQGTLQIDQESGNPTNFGSVGFTIQDFQPMGQSFTPSLSGVGFIQLQLYDPGSGDISGATIYLNLRSGSISGPILGSTAPVFMPAGYGYGNPPVITTFLFPTTVSVTPGTMYYFDIFVETGSAPWKVGLMERGNTYPGGAGYSNGNPFSSDGDMFFTEGVIVPEPSTAWLALAGGGLFFCVRRWHIKPC